MTCKELVDFMVDYLSDQLPKGQKEVFELHLSLCPPCLSFLETYRETIELGRCACTNPDGPVPEAVPERLVDAILAARKAHPESDSHNR